MTTMSRPVHQEEIEAQVWQAGEIDARRLRLGAAAGAYRIGVAVIDIAPGARSTPPHIHADEDEIFYVLSGDGLSWQSVGRAASVYPVTEGDVLLHRSHCEAHTMIAGPAGMTVLVLAEGSRSGITYLPRTKTFWLGPRWSPADSPPPFAADAAAGSLQMPDPATTRPPTIMATSDCPDTALAQGRFRSSRRDLGTAIGSDRLAFSLCTLKPGARSCPRHWHTIREECFYVVEGSGTAAVGSETHDLRPGSLLLRTPGSGVAHAIDAGPEGLTFVAMGDRLPGDACFYPDSGKLNLGNGIIFRPHLLDYFDGESDAEADRP